MIDNNSLNKASQSTSVHILLSALSSIKITKKDFLAFYVDNYDDILELSDTEHIQLLDKMKKTLNMGDGNPENIGILPQIDGYKITLLRVLDVYNEKDSLLNRVVENIDNKDNILDIIRAEKILFTILPVFELGSFYHDVREELDISEKKQDQSNDDYEYLLLLQDALGVSDMQDRLEKSLEKKSEHFTVSGSSDDETTLKNAIEEAQDFNLEFHIEDDYFYENNNESEPEKAIDTFSYL